MPTRPKIQPTRSVSSLKLNSQQRMFVEYILADKNFCAVEAARKAGYKNPAASGYGLLKHKGVNNAIGRAIQERIDRTQVTQDRVLLELAAIAFSNIQDLLSDDGKSFKNLKEVDERIGRSIASIKVKYRTGVDLETGEPYEIATEEIRFWNKNAALELLAKHLGMITEKQEHSGEVKLTMDYAKLYQPQAAAQPNNPDRKTLTLDPVEYQIQNPTEPPPDPKQATYSVDELAEAEDGEIPDS